MVNLRVVGFDPSLRNWGLAKGTYCLDDARIHINELAVTQPALPTGKQVRQNSKDLVAGQQLAEAAMAFAKDAQAVFVEVPVGSQSSRAMASYGICVGVLGALRAFGIPFFEVTPLEVKMISVGSRTATKEQMISWGVHHHPGDMWPTKMEGGVKTIVASKAEHMADAIAAIYAGLETSEFKQMLHMSQMGGVAANA